MLDRKAMGRSARKKGQGFEREVVLMAREAGVDAEKPRGSGFGGTDVYIMGRRVECKRRAGGMGTIYRWLEGMWAVVYRADREDALVTLRLGDLLEILAMLQGEPGAQGGSNQEGAPPCGMATGVPRTVKNIPRINCALLKGASQSSPDGQNRD